MQLIITDLTRFSEGKDKVCIAGIDIESQVKCFRPIPYLLKSEIIDLAIVPGEIMEGVFIDKSVNQPHVEDVKYSKLKWVGPCKPEDFENVLKNTTQPTVYEGFDKKVLIGERYILLDDPPSKSIITLCLQPRQIELFMDNYGKVKLKIIDKDANIYNYMPIADLGFFLHLSSKSQNLNYIDDINNFIWKQERLYLRIGLSRYFESPNGKKGFWMQVNGIYTFPHYLLAVRTYN